MYPKTTPGVPVHVPSASFSYVHPCALSTDRGYVLVVIYRAFFIFSHVIHHKYKKIFLFRRSKRQRIFPLFFFTSQES